MQVFLSVAYRIKIDLSDYLIIRTTGIVSPWFFCVKDAYIAIRFIPCIIICTKKHTHRLLNLYSGGVPGQSASLPPFRLF